MPTTYTHDLFGREVYRELPKDLQERIRRYGDLYRIGQHGPDILFYYRVLKNRVNQLGTRMHRETASYFFEEGLKKAREEQDERLLVYLMGFACHYMLDSTCHPYIKTLTDTGVVSHGKIEKELDRVLMLKEGKDPLHFYPSRCIVPSMKAARTIHKAIPDVDTPRLLATLRWMKFSTNLMVCDDNGRRQRVILPLLKVLGLYEYVGDNFMKKGMDTSCLPMLEDLLRLFDQAKEETAPILCRLYEIYQNGGKLPERFERNYE